MSYEFAGFTNLRNTLPVLPAIESGPGYPARVLALEKERFSLPILEAEDFAITADIELALKHVSKSAEIASDCAGRYGGCRPQGKESSCVGSMEPTLPG